MIDEAASSPRRERVWLLSICALALVLRAVKLDAPLWYDEILTLVRFVRLPLSAIVTTYSSLNNHVLYSLEAHGMLALFGEHAWALRLPAMAFGVGSVAAAYFLAREAVGVWEARLATLLLAVSYHHVWFSQNARGYTGLLTFSLIATLIFVRCRRHESFRPWVLYAICVAAAGYTHLTAALFFASHAAVYGWLVARRAVALRRGVGAPPASPGRAPAAGLALGALLTALLHAPLVPQMLGAFSKVTERPPTQAVAAVQAVTPALTANWKSPLWTLLETLRGFGDLGPLLFVLVPVAAALLGVGAVSLFRRSPLLAAVYLVNIPSTMLVLVLAGFRLWPRYFFLDIAFLVLCLTRGLFASIEYASKRLELGERVRRYLVLGGGAGAVASSLLLLPKNYQHPKQDFEGAMHFVSAHKAPSDKVAVVGLAALPYEEYYQAGFTTVHDAAELEALRQAAGATWLVYSFSGHAKNNFPDVMAVAASEFQKARSFPGTLGDGWVTVLKSER